MIIDYDLIKKSNMFFNHVINIIQKYQNCEANVIKNTFQENNDILISFIDYDCDIKKIIISSEVFENYLNNDDEYYLLDNIIYKLLLENDGINQYWNMDYDEEV